MEILDLLLQAAPILCRGVGYTLVFAVASMLGGLLLGFSLAIARIVTTRWAQWPSTPPTSA